MFLISETPFQYVRRQEVDLGECNCYLFDRKIPNNARDFLDEYVVSLLNKQSWPKDTPIRILDIGSGGLLQIATIMTSLANNGYMAELVIVEEEIASSGKYVQGLERLFKTINTQLDSDLLRIIGKFSSVDSYLARVRGVAPLKFHELSRLSLMERQTLRDQGIKARYLVPYFGKHASANEKYAKEFRESELCTGKAPDLILLIDDINEFHPYGVSSEEYGGLSYFFHNEVVEPFRKLNQESVFLATKKSNGEVKVLKYSPESKFVGKVIHKYLHLVESNQYVVDTTTLSMLAPAAEPTSKSVIGLTNAFAESTSDNVSTEPQPLNEPVTQQKSTANSKTREQPSRYIIAMAGGLIGAAIGVALVMTGIFAALGAGFIATALAGAASAIIGVVIAEICRFAYIKFFDNNRSTPCETNLPPSRTCQQQNQERHSDSTLTAHAKIGKMLSDSKIAAMNPIHESCCTPKTRPQRTITPQNPGPAHKKDREVELDSKKIPSFSSH
jgi:hypothetical protein